LVERNLAKVEVESSRLFSRSKFKKGGCTCCFPFFDFDVAQWQSGYVADCKSVKLGSIPGCASSTKGYDPVSFLPHFLGGLWSDAI